MRFFSPDVQNQLLQFIGDHHHVAAQRVHQLARAVGFHLHVAAGAVFRNPAHRLTLFHARQLDNPAELSQRFADAFVALLVGQFHPSHIGRNADVVGHEHQQGIWVGILAVLLDRRKLLFIRSAAEQRLHAAHKKHLEGRHQRGSSRPIQNLGQIRVRQIEIEQTEVAHIVGHQMFENRLAKALAEEDFIPHEDVRRPELFS